MNRNMNARNFGLRSSNMARALETAYRLKNGNGDNTKNQTSPLRMFAKFVKEELKIHDLRKIERKHVVTFAEHLNDKYEYGEFSSPGTAQAYLAKVNVALSNARNDEKCVVRGVRDAGLARKDGIARTDRSASQHAHDAAKAVVSERLGVQLELQRNLGLRFKESCLIDAKAVLAHAEKNGMIKIIDGTKGGRPREFPVANLQQIHALRQAVEIQGNHRSLIPENLTWRQYQNQCYRELLSAGFKCHENRHHFANNRYETLSGGVQSPVRSGIEHGIEHHKHIAEKLNISIKEAKELDQKWRLKISQELGHSRVSITNNYLG